MDYWEKLTKLLTLYERGILNKQQYQLEVFELMHFYSQDVLRVHATIKEVLEATSVN